MKNNEIAYLMQSFLKEKQFLKKQTINSYKYTLKQIQDFFNTYKIFRISAFKREHSIDFVAYLRERKNKNSTIRQRIKILKSFLRYALELGKIKKIEFAKFNLQDSFEEMEEKELRVFDLQEIKLLIKEAKDDLKDYLRVAFFTGLRTGELLGLKVKDIDMLDRKISIKRSLGQDNILNTPKNFSSFRKIDILPIIENTLKSLCKNKSNDDFLFSVKREKLRKDFKQLQVSLGIKSLRKLYDTRHSFASIMMSNGEESLWVSRVMLGHSNINTTFKYYAKYLPKNVSNRALFLNGIKLA